MHIPEDYKNNPLYSDITRLDHLSPQPTFQYKWNSLSGRWEPLTFTEITDELIGISGETTETNRILSGISGTVAGGLEDLASGLQDIHIGVDLDHDTETHRLLSGISGSLEDIHIGVDLDHDTETHRLLSGISGSMTDGIEDLISGLEDIHIGVDLDHDTETHRLLSGISGSMTDGIEDLISGLEDIHIGVDLDHDTETHRLLSGVSGKLSSIGGSLSGNFDITGDVSTVSIKLRTKTITQKIEEDFILLESIPSHQRYGSPSGRTYGEDRSVMDDIFGTHFSNSRKIDNSPETGHADYLIHAEWMDPCRPKDSKYVFDTDTQYGIRQENSGASLINSYELQDYNNLYKRGLVDHMTLFNRSPYPLQFHTADEVRASLNQPVSPKTDDILFLDPDFAVKIKNDEAGRIFIKRPHTLSGYNIDYSITYKVPGDLEI